MNVIKNNNDIQQKNIELLIEGYWYEDLPPILEIEDMKEKLREIIKDIDEDRCDDFRKKEGIIIGYKNINSPVYIHNDGIEPVTFFEFKKNGGLREMQIPNLKYYCSFVYNTIAVYDELFIKLYNNPEYAKYVCSSNSYLLFNELFYIKNIYDESTEIVKKGFFAVNNNKTTSQLASEKNNASYLRKQGTKLYSVKVDIESFYPNIYTHYLKEIKNLEPYNENFSCDAYFDFLDLYNMKINNNQTKGIVTGVYSSVVSAELLMLCVDYEILRILGENITYIRYVDDMTFFSDSLEEIYSKLPLIQRILNKYRLRINSNKTEVNNGISSMSNADIYGLKQKFGFFNSDSEKTINYDKELFYNIKKYISKAYNNSQKSEIKAFLSMFRNSIALKRLQYSMDEKIDLKEYTVAYMLQLACLEPLVASRCYRVIIALIDEKDDEEQKEKIIKMLESKNEYINSTYHDSLIQIWHYYVLGVYDSKKELKELIDSFGDSDINPIILAGFVKEGRKTNKELIDHIVDAYKKRDYQISETNYWMSSIMNSKWWLPLLLIYLKDGYNYYDFFESNNFCEFYKMLKKRE